VHGRSLHFTAQYLPESLARMVQNINGNPASLRWLCEDIIPWERSPDGLIHAARIKTDPMEASLPR